MCLIVAGDKNIPITKEFIANVQKRNGDGVGIMWIQDNKINTKKIMTGDIDEIKQAIDEIYEFDPYIHFRWKTHGAINEANCHPFYCGYGIWMMHNGVIRIETKSDETKSDTWHFVDQMVGPLFKNLKNPWEFVENPAFTAIMEELVGGANRIVFGSKHGYILINHDTWFQIKNPKTKMEGLFVSNQYAWDEWKLGEEEKKETAPWGTKHLSKKERKRYQRDRFSKATAEVACAVLTKNPETGGFSTWKSAQTGLTELEEYKDPWYLDDDWNVWENKPAIGGFIRRHDVDWNDLAALVDKPCAKFMETWEEVTKPLAEQEESTVTTSTTVTPPYSPLPDPKAPSEPIVYVKQYIKDANGELQGIWVPSDQAMPEVYEDDEQLPDPIAKVMDSHGVATTGASLITEHDEAEEQAAQRLLAERGKEFEKEVKDDLRREQLLQKWLNLKPYEINTMVLSEHAEAAEVLSMIIGEYQE